MNELLNIHNSAKVVNVKEPEAGMWTVKVLCDFPACLLFSFQVGMLCKGYKIAYLYILAVPENTFNESTCVGGLEHISWVVLL